MKGSGITCVADKLDGYVVDVPGLHGAGYSMPGAGGNEIRNLKAYEVSRKRYCNEKTSRRFLRWKSTSIQKKK